ncbi:MAG: site-2 protease family protein [Patescibacteria group bacterium]
MFSLLFEQPALFIVLLLAIVFALSFHEFGHAAVSYLLGDETAKRAGRLTLNPLAHLDLFGFILMIIVGFGWAKPVPFNPYNLKWKKWGPVAVSLAGPFFNLILALVAGLSFRALTSFGIFGEGNALLIFLFFLVIYNLGLMIFNLIPVPPLDGSRLLFLFLDHFNYIELKRRIETQGSWVLFLVIIFDSVFRLGIFSALFGFVQSVLGCAILGASGCGIL